MTFSESLYLIEQELYKNRMLTTITLKDIRANKLHLSAVYNIERHNDYIIDCLFKYVRISGKRLFLNEHLVEDPKQLGMVLKEERTKRGLSINSFFKDTGCLPKSIAKIEGGDRYRKSTLVTYMSKLAYVLNLQSDANTIEENHDKQ